MKKRPSPYKTEASEPLAPYSNKEIHFFSSFEKENKLERCSTSYDKT